MRAQRLAILDTGLDDALQFAGRIVIGFEGRLAAPVDVKGVFSLKRLFVGLMPPCFERLRPEETASVSIGHDLFPLFFQ